MTKNQDAVLANDISYIKTEITEIKARLDTKYVTQDQFEPIKKIVYGVATLVLVSVGAAILSLILNK